MKSTNEASSAVRDELARLISSRHTMAAVDAILAAGYRKPRTITTAEERATLAPGTIAADSAGNAWKRGSGSWVGTGDGPPLWDDEDATFTVLWEPEAEASR